jgi:hypothetical protein
MLKQQAPSARHGKQYKKHHQRRATNEKDFKLMNIVNQTPAMAQRVAANVAHRENFLKQQQSVNNRGEVSRLYGYLNETSIGRRDDEYKGRMASLLNQMGEKSPKPIIGPEGTYR